MTPEQATAVIQDTIFRPGWKLGARPDGRTSVLVWADIDTVDTRYPDPDGIFRTVHPIRPEQTIDVEGLNLTGLFHAILTQLVDRIDKHENREFLQIRRADGTFWSPLHPHTFEGELAWMELAEDRLQTALNAEMAALS